MQQKPFSDRRKHRVKVVKVTSEVVNFILKFKIRKSIELSEALSIGIPRELKENTSLKKISSML